MEYSFGKGGDDAAVGCGAASYPTLGGGLSAVAMYDEGIYIHFTSLAFD